MRLSLRVALGLLPIFSSLMGANVASACGCLAPPGPSIPIVQAGEQIMFAMKNGQVTAYVQIKYQGDPSDFGWLVPLPSIPTLQLGTDELFTQLHAKTQPYYAPNYTYDSGCPEVMPSETIGCAASDTAETETPGAANDDSQDLGAYHDPSVIQSSIGPYDFAVLKADDESDMLAWLNTNHYFVPANSDAAITPYIHPGAYFLALKLQSGQSTGNIQPVVVQYNSDLPMIPIVLTSVGATPHMPIEAYILGESRAIPRNYYQVVLNEALIDWNGYGYNYANLVSEALAEAPNRHGFVTEYADSSSVMQGVLDPPGRFGDITALAQITDPGAYVQYLINNNYSFTTELLGVLEQYIPLPSTLPAGVTPAQFYGNVDLYLSQARATDASSGNGDAAAPYNFNFDPVACTAEINMRVIQPTLTAGALFTAYPTLTRFYTELSPADMTLDPVFSFNPDLPPVPQARTADFHVSCSQNGTITTTTDGLVIQYQSEVAPLGPNDAPLDTTMPAALRIETVLEAGQPTTVTDNTATIKAALTTLNTATQSSEATYAAAHPSQKSGGCTVGTPSRNGTLLTLLAFVSLAAILRRSRRRGVSV